MRNRMLKMLIAGATLSFMACSGDETINENTALATAEAMEDLAECTEDNMGDMVFVEDSSATFYCGDGIWSKLEGKDGQKGTNGKDTLVVLDTLVINETLHAFDTVVVNQKDTVVVFSTAVGVDGESCFAEAVDDGYKIVCDGDSVGVVLNGEDGGSSRTDSLVIRDTLHTSDTVVVNQKDTVVVKDTVLGIDGESCLAEAVEDGYKIVCDGDSVGMIENAKSLCGTTEYDPATEFCDGVEVYELCGGKSYDPNTQCCFDGLAASCLVDDRDGQKYKTVVIGTQTWMAQNLNYADSLATESLLERSWCYDNSADSCAKYGRLYTWAAAIDSVALKNDPINPQECGYDVEGTCNLTEPVQGICPEGWHLPNTAEWKTLVNAAGGASNADKSLKTTYGWNDDYGGTDTYGFSVLPAGVWQVNELEFTSVGSGTGFWHSTEGDIENAIVVAYDDDYVGFEVFIAKTFGLSVRCIKD